MSNLTELPLSPACHAISKCDFTLLYEQHQESINEVHRRCQQSGHRIIGPYLVEPNDAYIQAQVKVVFVGQETGDWAETYCDIPTQLHCYRSFNLNGSVEKPTHPGAFWNVIRKLERLLIGKSHACAALNINRYSQNGRRPSWGNQGIMAELDFLLLEELKLLRPDVVIFFTGPHYDPRLKALLQVEHAPVEGFTPRQFSRMESPILPAQMFRTYHPTYLRRRHFEPRVIEALKREIQ